MAHSIKNDLIGALLKTSPEDPWKEVNKGCLQPSRAELDLCSGHLFLDPLRQFA